MRVRWNSVRAQIELERPSSRQKMWRLIIPDVVTDSGGHYRLFPKFSIGKREFKYNPQYYSPLPILHTPYQESEPSRALIPLPSANQVSIAHCTDIVDIDLGLRVWCMSVARQRFDHISKRMSRITRHGSGSR